MVLPTELPGGLRDRSITWPRVSLRGRAGLTIILYVFPFILKKKSTFHSSYTISSTIVACETRLTKNGIPPKRNLRMVSLIYYQVVRGGVCVMLLPTELPSGLKDRSIT